nr:MAG TPA: hypothetical protein [Caudoviricetes sp.]
MFAEKGWFSVRDIRDHVNYRQASRFLRRSPAKKY